MRLFDEIAERYDLLNRIISFGMDLKWREQMVTLVLEKHPNKVLDLATGTGDVIKLLKEKAPHLEVTGLDLSLEMMEIAKKKVKGAEFITGDAHVLKECRRVLKKGGRLVILELLPPNTRRFTGKLYSLYLKLFVPLLGGVFSGDFRAYRYLSRSVLNFLTPDRIVKMMEEEGFEVSFKPLLFSVAGIFAGDKISSGN